MGSLVDPDVVSDGTDPISTSPIVFEIKFWSQHKSLSMYYFLAMYVSP